MIPGYQQKAQTNLLVIRHWSEIADVCEAVGQGHFHSPTEELMTNQRVVNHGTAPVYVSISE